MTGQPYQNYPPPGQPPQPETKPGTPWWKQPLIIALGAGIIGIAIGSAMTATDATSPAPTQTVTATATVTADPEPAPTITETTTVTAEPTEPSAEPAPEPEPVPEPTQAETDDLAEQVAQALELGTEWAPTWAQPITNLEGRGTNELWVDYQQTLTDPDKVQLGQYIHNFSRAADIQLRTIVITDTSGINFNVWCGATICADNVRDID